MEYTLRIQIIQLLQDATLIHEMMPSIQRYILACFIIYLPQTVGLIRTTSSAIKFGSFSLFDFKGLIVDNITIVDSNRGHRFQIRDEGTLSSFVFQ